MALEKTGKAYLAAGGGCSLSELREKFGHVAFVKAFGMVEKNSAVAEVLGYRDSVAMKKAHASAKHLARDIEQLQPQNAGEGPNTEYPWTLAGAVIAPCAHDFAAIVQRCSSPSGLRLLKMLTVMHGDRIARYFGV